MRLFLRFRFFVFWRGLLQQADWPQFLLQLPHSRRFPPRVPVLLTSRRVHLTRGTHEASSCSPTGRVPSWHSGDARGSGSGDPGSNLSGTVTSIYLFVLYSGGYILVPFG